MNKTDIIDFMYVLEPHGWSTFIIFYDGKIHYFEISHSFSDPLTDLINLILNISNGSSFHTFDWYSEPGGHRFKFCRNSKEKHKIVIVIEEIFNEVFEEVDDTKKVLEFEIKEKQFTSILLKQIEKLEVLLQDPTYAKDRKEDFPLELYNKLNEKT